MNFKRKIMGVLTPLTIFFYLTICCLCVKFDWTDRSIWWKMLPIFVLNLVVPIILGFKKIKFSIPLVITIIYITMGFISSYLGFPLWHPGWTIFLLIPVIEIIVKPSKKENGQSQKEAQHYDYESEE